MHAEFAEANGLPIYRLLRHWATSELFRPHRELHRRAEELGREAGAKTSKLFTRSMVDLLIDLLRDGRLVLIGFNGSVDIIQPPPEWFADENILIDIDANTVEANAIRLTGVLIFGADCQPIPGPADQLSEPDAKTKKGPPRNDYRASDAPILEDIHQGIATGSYRSVRDGARANWRRAAGTAKEANKVARLMKHYRERYREQES